MHHAPHSVLVVDDEPQVLAATAALLTRLGYATSVARSAREAIVQLGQQRFDAMICDVGMPVTSGLELVPQARALDPELAVVMISGMDNARTANTALQSGATDYLVKPVTITDLDATLKRALERRDSAARRRRSSRARRAQLSLEGAEAARQRIDHGERVTMVLDALMYALEDKDPHMRGRTARIVRLAGAIAQQLKLDPEVVRDVQVAARLHDIGMVGIREAVLLKPTALTDDEFEHVKDHVRIGLEILAPLPELDAVIDYVQDHHEHWDGKGYPRMIAGESISIGGRILAAADAYDTLVSGRSFRSRVDPEQALTTIGYVVGSLLEPRVYDALCAAVRAQPELRGSA